MGSLTRCNYWRFVNGHFISHWEQAANATQLLDFYVKATPETFSDLISVQKDDISLFDCYIKISDDSHILYFYFYDDMVAILQFI